MNKYINKKISQTFCTVIISGMLTSSMVADISKYEGGQAVPRYAENKNYLLHGGGTSLSYEPRKNVFTGTYLSSTTTEFENMITNFFAKLSSAQEKLGAEFERVLFDNLWELYQS